MMLNTKLSVYDFFDKLKFENLHFKFCKNSQGHRKHNNNVGIPYGMPYKPIHSYIMSEVVRY